MRFAVITFTILFGILSFAPNMQGGQFFKLSEVIEHYETHQESKESFSSFIDFVKEHYFTNHHTNENERNLPFKSSVASPLVLVFQQVQMHEIPLSKFIEEEDDSCFGEPKNRIQNKIISVWNPPQVV